MIRPFFIVSLLVCASAFPYTLTCKSRPDSKEEILIVMKHSDLIENEITEGKLERTYTVPFSGGKKAHDEARIQRQAVSFGMIPVFKAKSPKQNYAILLYARIGATRAMLLSADDSSLKDHNLACTDDL